MVKVKVKGRCTVHTRASCNVVLHVIFTQSYYVSANCKLCMGEAHFAILARQRINFMSIHNLETKLH
jgi:hypothetical protein